MTAENYPYCEHHPLGCEDDCPLDFARHYAEMAGWRVLPIKPGGKHPPMGGWRQVATHDLVLIEKWWTEVYPNHGVGVLTGPSSGVFVLDVDVANGKVGAASLAALEAEHGPLPKTAKVRTGSGGWHYYFKWPAGQEIRNDAGKRLGPDLDIRGEGGQVVAPPTMHASGKRYEWVEDPMVGDLEVAEAPQWLVEMLVPPLPKPKPKPPPPGQPMPMPLAAQQRTTATQPGPADEYNAATSWPGLLEADGWTLHSIATDGEQHWRRPGKDEGESSASFGGGGEPTESALHVFTTNHPFLESDKSYSRFQYMALRDHGGDPSAAATAWRQAQRGTSPPSGVTSASQHVDQSHPLTDEPPMPADPSDPWPDEPPHPLTTSRDPRRFPTEALPPVLADYLAALEKAYGTAPDMAATMVLPVLSAVAAGRWLVRCNPTWTEELALYVATVAYSGSMKSPSFKAAMEPLDAIQSELIAKRGPEVAEALSQRRVDEQRLRKLESTVSEPDKDGKSRKGSDLDSERMVLAEHLFTTPEPAVPSLWTTDSTPEQLATLMAQNGERYAWLSEEGGFFEASLRYRTAGTSANLDVFLSPHNGGSVRVNRASKPPISLKRPTLVVGVTVQPSVLQKAQENPELSSRGLIPRFLISWPPDQAVVKSTQRPDLPAHIKAAYARCLHDLDERGQRVRVGERIELTYTPASAAMFDAWCVEVVDMWRPGGGGILQQVRSWANKLEGTTGRLAAIFALVQNPDAREVNEDDMARAIEVARYFADHAAYVHGQIAEDPQLRAAATCLRAIRDIGNDQVSTREVHDRVRAAGPKTADEVRLALSMLAREGWLRWLGKVSTPKGGHPSERWQVRPLAFKVEPERIVPTFSAERRGTGLDDDVDLI